MNGDETPDPTTENKPAWTGRPDEDPEEAKLPLRDKIRRRAKRAFEDFDKNPSNPTKFHRITDVTAKSLTYRCPHVPNEPLYSGKRVVIKRDVKGRIYVPAEEKLNAK